MLAFEKLSAPRIKRVADALLHVIDTRLPKWGAPRVDAFAERAREELQKVSAFTGQIKELIDLYQVDRTGAHQMRELLRRSRLHIAELERRRHDLDTQIREFKDVEAQVIAGLRQRGVDPESA